jgi:hypothetical protein
VPFLVRALLPGPTKDRQGIIIFPWLITPDWGAWRLVVERSVTAFLKCGDLPPEALAVVGNDQRLADPASLAAMLGTSESVEECASPLLAPRPYSHSIVAGGLELMS